MKNDLLYHANQAETRELEEKARMIIKKFRTLSCQIIQDQDKLNQFLACDGSKERAEVKLSAPMRQSKFININEIDKERGELSDEEMNEPEIFEDAFDRITNGILGLVDEYRMLVSEWSEVFNRLHSLNPSSDVFKETNAIKLTKSLSLLEPLE